MKKILTLVMFAALVAGCSNDEKPENLEQGSMATLTVTIKGGVLSRATDPGTVNERKISGLEFYVFDSSGAADTKVNGNGYLGLTSNDLRTDNTYRLQVTDGANKKVVVVANSSMGQTTPSYTYDALILALSKGEFTVNGTSVNTTVVPTGGFEMAGVAEGISIATGQIEDVDIALTRLVSKVNEPDIPAAVPVELDSLDIDKAFGVGSGIKPTDAISFTYEGFALINGLAKSTVAFPFTSWADADWKTMFESKYIAPTFETNGDFKTSYSGVVGGSFFLKDTVAYVYENHTIRGTGTSGVVGAVAKSVYAYIIKGTLASGGKTATRYWRVNFRREDNWKVERNAMYTVTVNKISTPGYSTPERATGNQDDIIPDKDEQALDFIVNVVPWNLLIENQEM